MRVGVRISYGVVKNDNIHIQLAGDAPKHDAIITRHVDTANHL